jgi:thiol-disulfide isomerase/thioredoxin
MLKRKTMHLVALFCFVLSGSCGLRPAGSNDLITNNPNPNPNTGEALSVYLFSAPWCAECNRELPEIKQKYLNELSAPQQVRVKVTVFVVTGKTPGQLATQEVAEEYGKSLELPFTMMADKYYKIYRGFFEEGNAIPAAVVLDPNKNIIQLYEPGTTDVNNLFEKIKANLK